MLAQSAPHRPELYAVALWALLLLVATLALAFLLMRLVRMLWAHSDRRAMSGIRHPEGASNDSSDTDPWAEAARRMQPEPDEQDEEDEPQR